MPGDKFPQKVAAARPTKIGAAARPPPMVVTRRAQ
jgi:hypothetical protein